jgi:hypothetical protein
VIAGLRRVAEASRRLEGLGERGFGCGARVASALGRELVEHETELGVVAHVVDHDQGLAGADVIAVAREDLAHDAAFLVLHRLVIELGLELADGDDGAGERRGVRPDADRAADERDRDQRAPDFAAPLPARLAVASRLRQQCCKGHGSTGVSESFRRAHASASVLLAATNGTTRLAGVGLPARASTAAVGPNISSAPRRSTSSLSSAASSARW